MDGDWKKFCLLLFFITNTKISPVAILVCGYYYWKTA